MVKNGCTCMLCVWMMPQTVMLLLESGADPCARDADGWSVTIPLLASATLRPSFSITDLLVVQDLVTSKTWISDFWISPT